jgi:hypothetical protein
VDAVDLFEIRSKPGRNFGRKDLPEICKSSDIRERVPVLLVLRLTQSSSRSEA